MIRLENSPVFFIILRKGLSLRLQRLLQILLVYTSIYFNVRAFLLSF